jgi:hypothetical protein
MKTNNRYFGGRRQTAPWFFPIDFSRREALNGPSSKARFI